MRAMDEDLKFPLAEKLIYLDNAAQGALPESTIKVMEEYIGDRCAWIRGDVDWREGNDKWAKKAEGSKELFAKIIGAKDEEIAFIPNTTTGVNTVVNMLPPKAGGNVVSTGIAYPMGATVSLKQRERGLEARFTKGLNGEIHLEEFEKSIDDGTLAVIVEQAGWHNGYLHDLKAISEVAHEHGAFLVVDGVQSAGAYAHDVHRDGVDFLAVSTYKWLLGGPYSQTVGFLYVNERLVDSFQPVYVGNQTIEDVQLQTNMYDRFDLYDFKYKKGINRFQIYPKSEFSYVAVENSMRVLLKQGIKNIDRKIRSLCTTLVEGLQEMGIELQTPSDERKRLYVNAKIKNNREMEKELYKHGVSVSARVGGLRISPHFYAKDENIEKFLEILKKLI